MAAIVDGLRIFRRHSIDLDAKGQIPFTVTESGNRRAYWKVCLYDRVSGQLLDTQWSDANGDGVFRNTALDTPNRYLIVAYDPDGGTQYNVVAFDRVTSQAALP